MGKLIKLDSLYNFVAGLGTAKDKSTSSVYGLNVLSQEQLTNAYRGDWVARKVVTAPAQDATREWRAWQADEDQITLLEKEERRLDLQRKLFRALVKARLYGGAALIMGVDGAGDPDEELVPERVKQGALKFVHVVSRYEIAIGSLNQDVADELYGEPEYYTVSSLKLPTMQIHPTRVVRLLGAEVPLVSQSDGWSDSCLQAVDDAIKNVGLCSGGIAALLWESKVDVIKVPNLMESLATDEYKQRLLERFTLANSAKSMINALLLDKEEEWDRLEPRFAGMPDVLRMYLQIASGAADIPATRLMGQSPRGLANTGEHDARNYYDMVRSWQKNELTPVLSRFDDVFVRSVLGDHPDDVTSDWRPLWQLSDAEKATIALQKAQAHKIDVDNGLILEDALAQGRVNQIIEDDFYPGFEQALDDAKEEAQKQLDESDPEVVAQMKASRGLEPEKAPPPGLPGPDAGQSQPGAPEPRSPQTGKPPAASAQDWNPDQPREPDGKFGSGGGTHGKDSPIDLNQLTKVGGQMGSNPAGVFQAYNGDKFYVKTSQSEDHARNEYVAADLYKAAGAPTMTYRDVAGGKHVATEMAPLEKRSSREFSPEELRQARENFAAHAWTANWDAAGLGHDNQVLSGGKVRTVDVGGALAYRAQGGLKGAAFGPEAREWDTMRDSKVNPENAQLFGSMTTQELRASAQKVAQIPSEVIHSVVASRGGSRALAEKMVARRDYVAKRAGVQTADAVLDAEPRSLYVRRDLVNVDDVRAWAREQGFATILPDLHATLIYSKSPVDWIKMGEPGTCWTTAPDDVDVPEGGLYVSPGGPRVVEQFPGSDAVVLQFSSGALSWRYCELRERGCSSDYQDFTPHVTITYDRPATPVDQMEPYRGHLIFGPEIFEEVKQGQNRRYDEVTTDYDPDQPRAPDGKWGVGGFVKSLFGGGKFANLSSEEQNAVRNYTKDGFREMNAGLRSGILSAADKAQVAAINGALEKLPPHQGEVFRTAKLTGGQFAAYVDARGQVISERGFTSTSQSGFRAFENSDKGQLYGFRIVSNGVGRDVSGLSKRKEEKEVLFPSGTNFRIGKVVGSEIQMEAVPRSTKDYDPDQPRAPDGKFGSAGAALKTVKDFVTSDAAKAVLKSAAGKIAEHKYELIGTAVIAGVALMKANLPPDVSDQLYEVATQLSKNAGVSVAAAKQSMRDAVDRLIALRRVAKDGELVTDAEDDVLSHLEQLRDLLDDDDEDLQEDYDPDQPREPDGKWGTGSGTKNVPEKVSGGSKERVAMRAALKQEKDHDKKVGIQQRILASFHVDYLKHSASGNSEKATAAQTKLEQHAAKYGLAKSDAPKYAAQHASESVPKSVKAQLSAPPQAAPQNAAPKVAPVTPDKVTGNASEHAGMKEYQKQYSEILSKSGQENSKAGQQKMQEVTEKLIASAKMQQFHALASDDPKAVAAHQAEIDKLASSAGIDPKQAGALAGKHGEESAKNVIGIALFGKPGLSYGHQQAAAAMLGQTGQQATAAPQPQTIIEKAKAALGLGTDKPTTEPTAAQQYASSFNQQAKSAENQGEKYKLPTEYKDEMSWQTGVTKLEYYAKSNAFDVKSATPEQKEAYFEKATGDKFPSSYSHLKEEAIKKFDRVVTNAQRIGSATPEMVSDAKAAYAKLPNEERNALSEYLGSGYAHLNETLRAGVMSPGAWKTAKNAQAALDKMPTYDGTVLRQTNLPDKEAAKYQPGMVVEARGFTSTSLNPEWNWSNGHEMLIKSKTGRAVMGNNIAEREVLFKFGTRFRVTNHEGKTIHMEEV